MSNWQVRHLGAVHKRLRQLGGRGVKNWSKLPTENTKKLPTWGTGVSKIEKNYQRRLWMVPNKTEKIFSVFKAAQKMTDIFTRKYANCLKSPFQL